METTIIYRVIEGLSRDNIGVILGHSLQKINGHGLLIEDYTEKYTKLHEDPLLKALE